MKPRGIFTDFRPAAWFALDASRDLCLNRRCRNSVRVHWNIYMYSTYKQIS